MHLCFGGYSHCGPNLAEVAVQFGGAGGLVRGREAPRAAPRAFFNEGVAADPNRHGRQKSQVNRLVTLVFIALSAVGTVAFARNGRENTSIPFVAGRASLPQ